MSSLSGSTLKVVLRLALASYLLASVALILVVLVLFSPEFALAAAGVAFVTFFAIIFSGSSEERAPSAEVTEPLSP